MCNSNIDLAFFCFTKNKQKFFARKKFGNKKIIGLIRFRKCEKKCYNMKEKMCMCVAAQK